MTRTRLSGIAAITLAFALILPISANAAQTGSYTVRKGDTLWKIAAAHKTTVGSLAQINGIKETAVLPLGKTIKVPSTTSASPSVSVDRSGSVSRAERAQMHTKVESAVLRSGPSTSNGKIAVLPKGANCSLLLTEGNWKKVALADGTCGYIYGSLLSSGPGTVNYSPSCPGTTAEADDSQSSLIETALACRGISYRSGGTSRSGFDCSGFTRYVFAKYGVSLPHNSAAQSRLGTAVSREDLQAGDLVFFETYRRGISHVGIYVGDNKFVHAPRHGRRVSVDSLGSSYYAPRYRGARRVR